MADKRQLPTKVARKPTACILAVVKGPKTDGGKVFLMARAGDGPTLAEAEVSGLLATHHEAGSNAWPEVEVTPEDLARHLARHMPPGGGAAELAALRGADLYLACACASGDQGAMLVFERTYFGEVDAAAARLRAGTALAVEVKQMLRNILFVADGPRPAAIADYAGRGDLRGWIRVTAVRELQRLLVKDRREVRLDDEAFLDVLSPAQDPELAWLRDRYRTELAESVRVALATTPARERSLLRYQLIDGLSIDQIGALHGVHRATAARWLAHARAAILERARAELMRRLGAAAEEIDSIIRLVHSRLDVSAERILGG